jgi:hypothetical protein
MKKILPLFFFILMNTWAHGQGTYTAAMDMSISYSGNADRAACGSRYEITAYYSDGSSAPVWTESLDGLGEGSWWTRGTKYFTFSSAKRLVRFHIFARRSWDRGWPAGCKSSDVESSKDVYVSINQPCHSESYGDFVPRYNGTLTLRVYPTSISINPTFNTVTDATNTTLTATGGFPNSTYLWQYYTSFTGWQNFPTGTFPQQNTLTFSGTTLPNDIFMQAYARRENIQVRIYYPCGNVYSNPVTLTPRLTAPRITGVTPNPPSCYGDQNGSFTVQFSRPLKPGEALVVQLDRQEAPVNTPGAMIDERLVTLDANNRFTWPSDRGARLYRIVTRGYITGPGGDQVATFTDATNAYRRNFEITQPGPITFNAFKLNDVRCFGGSDGYLAVNITGGNGNNVITYRNNDDGTTGTTRVGNNGNYGIGPLRPGTYTLSMTDAKGCIPRNASNQEVTHTITISQPAAPFAIDAFTITHPRAYGYSDGSLVIRLKGGTPEPDGSYSGIILADEDGSVYPYTGSVGNGTYTITYNNLPDGTYTFVARDALYTSAASGQRQGCIVNGSYILTQPPPLLVSTTITDSINCRGDGNGILTALASGGKPMANAPYYTYEWYEIVGGVPTPIGQSGTVANGLRAGRYQVKITDANNIEKLSDIINLIDPAALDIQFIETPVSCFEGRNGAVTALVTGGTPAYIYRWSNGGQGPVINNLATGTYTLDITDYHGCELTDVAFVAQPAAALQITAPVLTYPKAFGYTDGSIRLLLKGGTPLSGGAYNITWRKRDGTVLTTHSSRVVAGGYENLLGNLGAGEYTVTVTDANYTGPDPNMQSCIATASFTLTEPPMLLVNVAEHHYVSCKGDADGVLVATGTGGVRMNGALPYRFEWYKANGATYNPIGQTTDTARGLSTGTYKVIITDWNDISKESDPFLLVEPELLQVQLQNRAVSCNSGNDGFVKSTVTGGSIPYTWSWSNGATTPDIPDQPAGTYTLLLVDAHGCIQQPSSTITEPADPLAITNAVPVNPLAFGYTDGYITVMLKGGTTAADGSYQVQWLDGNNQVLTQHTESVTPNGYVTRLENAGDGTYTLQVKDAQFNLSANGSTSGCYVTGTYILKEPPLLTARINEHRYVSCKGDSDGKLVADATGGIPYSSGLPYQYQWFSIAGGSPQLIPQTDSIITGMPTGRYLVKVTDANNITRSSDTFFLAEPEQLSVSFNATAVTCASGQDGSASAIVSGGTAPFRYEWTTGDTTSSISNLTEGTYLLFVKDAHLCETQNQMDIYIPGGIVIDADIKAPVCNGYCDGYIRTRISGGVPPYSYEWSSGETGTSLEQLCAGKYTLTITDANGCKRIQTFNLPDPAPLLVKLGADKTLCNGQSWTVNADIADPLAQYVWGGEPALQGSAPQATLSSTGTYWVAVTDGKGCKGADTIRIQQNMVDISAEFVASTQVFRNENVSFINISNPMPERIEWVIPENRNITVLQNTPLLAELRFADTGVYQIHLRTRVGDCDKLFSKQITVLEQEHFTQPGGAQEPFIKTFEVMPNPNTGQFNVHIALDKEADVRLRMFNIISNQLVNDRKESPALQFNIGYQLNITAGTYLLLLETPMGHAIRKIIISQ